MNERARKTFRKHKLQWIASWLGLPLGLVATAFVVQGRSMAEKTATELLSPVSLVWWVSLVLAIKLWRRNERPMASILFCLVLMMYLTCAPVTAKFSMYFLESMIPTTLVSKENPLDTLVVLGGGTSEAPDGRAQLSWAGDRVGLAMQLYHQGMVKHLVVTGDALKGLENASQNDPSIQAKRILVGMGVPESEIEELNGSNTSEELGSLKGRTDLWKGKRCGLLTSASHMPRALRLAKRVGVEVLPILADYRILKSRFGFRDLIPNTAGASQTDHALHEFLGMLVGR